jgi:hypothetical protein
MPTGLHSSNSTIGDIRRCIRLLTDLESRWSGAGRSKAIIERLLAMREGHTVVVDPISRPEPVFSSRAGSPLVPASTSRGHTSRRKSADRSNVHDNSHKRPFSEAFPTADHGDHDAAVNADTELAQLQGQGEAVWDDIFWSDVISLDDASMALLNESWGNIS